MKRRIFLVLALLSLVFLGGCGKDNQKQGTLSAPQEIEVKIDSGRSYIIFDEVDNAEYYNIYINDVSVTVNGGGSGTITYDASKIITQPQKYSIKVKAGSSDYYDSAFSASYEYEHKASLSAPIISIDGTMLNWDKVANADFYDIVVTSNNPTMQSTYRFPNNKFNFATILNNKGEYLFKVKAVSENTQYLESIYSNEVRYQNIKTLVTPYKVQVGLNQQGQTILSFISSADVNSFVLEINGKTYNLSQEIISNYMMDSDYDNLYIINLSSFLNYANISLDNSKSLTIRVQALADGLYLRNSGFSNSINYQYKSVLNAPTISILKGSQSSTIKFTYNDTKYLSGFELYRNGEVYKTLPSTIDSVEVANTEIDGYALALKALSNNNNCYSSLLSNVVYLTDNKVLAQPSIDVSKLESGIVSWESVDNADKCYVEVYNQNCVYSTVVDAGEQNSIDISSYVEYGNYNIKIMAMAQGFNSAITTEKLNYSKKLDTVTNVAMGSGADVTTLSFDEVEDAYGYVVYYLPEDEQEFIAINHLFDGTNINLNTYLSEANSYKIKVQAIASSIVGMEAGELSQEYELQNTKTLTAPKLSITEENGKYYLNIDVEEAEKALASVCLVRVNYTSSYEVSFEDSRIDITSYFATAGNYTFMVQALANKDNQYLKDSNIASVSHAVTKQLDMVTNIKVTNYEEESKYILTFDEQTLVAKYEVTIVRADDETFEKKFEINSGFGDITDYITENGIYKVYVKAIALDNSFYTDSATSGNPYIFTKGLTLSAVSGLNVEKTTGQSMYLKWDAVDNASSYKVNVYYIEGDEERLLLSTNLQDSQIDLGSGYYKCFNKEGTYILKVKTIGDGKEYESSGYSTFSYNYVMQSVADFNRNTVFMYGNTYDYYVETYEELQNLIWYHYLYNNQVWKYSATVSYNLKIYCNLNLDTLAQNYSEDLYNEIKNLSDDASKMAKLGSIALSRYPEIAHYSLGYYDGKNQQDFCTHTSNMYIFRYVDLLNADKTEAVQSNSKSFPDKIEYVNSFEQRPSNYVFAIDKLDSIDVTTTEQLFMAAQYGKKPNFVGDSEVAEIVYQNARNILRQICSDSMTDYEKVCAIYDYLSVKVSYNHELNLADYSSQTTNIDNISTYLANVRDLYLEGVFYQTDSTSTTSESLSKAFVLMCAIEGIESIKVDGTKVIESANGGTTTIAHSWNKVYVDTGNEKGNQWYSVDIASSKYGYKYSGSAYEAAFGNTIFDIGTHTYFLVTDSNLSASLGLCEAFSHKQIVEASTSYDYYENTLYSNATAQISGNLKHNTANSVADELKSLMAYSMLNSKVNNTKYSIIAEFDMSEGAQDKDTQATNIRSQYYSEVNKQLNYNYACDSVEAFVFGNKLIILFHNYK